MIMEDMQESQTIIVTYNQIQIPQSAAQKMLIQVQKELIGSNDLDETGTIAAAKPPMILHFAETAYMELGGLQAVVAAIKLCRDYGHAVLVAADNSMLKKYFDEIQLPQLVPVYSNLREAMKVASSSTQASHQQAGAEYTVRLQAQILHDEQSGCGTYDLLEMLLPSFCHEYPGSGSIMFTWLNSYQRILQEYGLQEAKRTIMEFMAILREETGAQGFVFMLDSPWLAVLLPSPSLKLRMIADNIREKTILAGSQSFPLDCSMSISRIEDVSANPQIAFKQASSRLWHARSLGSNMLCEDDTPPVREKASLRVLIMDADPLFSNLISRHLSNNGCLCQVINSGINAMEVINDFHPQAIVADVFLQGSNVFRLRELCLLDTTTAVIPWLLNGHHKNSTTIASAHYLKMYHFLKRPIEYNELLGLIQHLACEAW